MSFDAVWGIGIETITLLNAQRMCYICHATDVPHTDGHLPGIWKEDIIIISHTFHYWIFPVPLYSKIDQNLESITEAHKLSKN